MRKEVKIPPRVLLLIDTTHKSSQDILRGILSYIREYGPWTVDLKTGRSDEVKTYAFAKKGCDGAIVKANNPAIHERLSKLRIPLISIDGCAELGNTIGELRCDNRAIAQSAAAFLLEKKCKSYAIVGSGTKREYSEERIRHFSAAIASTNRDCKVFRSGGRSAHFRKWLSSLQRPVGLFAVCDLRARETLDICHELGIDVPGEMLILGADNDELICETTSPTLSSIPFNTQEAGYRAAQLLDEAMQGHLPPKRTTIPYCGSSVIERQSTERDFAIDELIRRARESISMNLDQHFTVTDLIRTLNCSRRYLELHFKRVLRLSPGEEILRLRTAKAIQLLKTPLTQAVIADRCGFSDASHMNKVLIRLYGKRSSDFRRNAVELSAP